MRTARVYQSFEDFEREELRSSERFSATVDEMLDEMFCEELDFELGPRGRGRKQDSDDEE